MGTSSSPVSENKTETGEETSPRRCACDYHRCLARNVSSTRLIRSSFLQCQRHCAPKPRVARNEGYPGKNVIFPASPTRVARPRNILQKAADLSLRKPDECKHRHWDSSVAQPTLGLLKILIICTQGFSVLATLGSAAKSLWDFLRNQLPVL